MADPNASAHQGFHAFFTLEEGAHGSFEVFYSDGETIEPEAETYAIGWYWQPCFPGCLPDGEPCGPFDTSKAAYLDANDL